MKKSKNTKKILIILGLVVIILNSITIISFFKNSTQYTKYYNYSTDEILSLSNFNAYEILSSKEEESDYNGGKEVLEKSLNVFTGVVKYENIKLNDNKTLRINKKFGNVKIILVNSNERSDDVVTLNSEDLGTVEIPSGSYNMVLAGKWFVGKIILN